MRLQPINLVQQVHGVCLSGGSAFGLAVADGVMRYLDERQIGFDTGVAKVPIVGGAVLFDLAYAAPGKRPTAEMGYKAAAKADSTPLAQGCYGAGTGATVAKMLPNLQPKKSGFGIGVDEDWQSNHRRCVCSQCIGEYL